MTEICQSTREPERIRAIVPLHVEYWQECNPGRYLGGPFADRSGGLVTFEAESIEEATGIIMSDPFVTSDLLKDRWIKEWMVEQGDS